MRVRSLLSSKITLIKHPKLKKPRHDSKSLKRGPPSQKQLAPRSQDFFIRHEAAPAPRDTSDPTTSRNRPHVNFISSDRNHTFRKTRSLILRQIKSEGKDPRKQRSKPKRPSATKYFKRTFRKTRPVVLRQIKSEGKDPRKQRSKSKRPSATKYFKYAPHASTIAAQAKIVVRVNRSSADTYKHSSKNAFTLTKVPLRTPSVRRHISAPVFHKVAPREDRNFQKVPSGPVIQHPTTTIKKAKAENPPPPAPKSILIPKIKRKSTIPTFRKFGTTLLAQHIPVSSFPTIKKASSSPSSPQTPLNKSYRSYKTS